MLNAVAKPYFGLYLRQPGSDIGRILHISAAPVTVQPNRSVESPGVHINEPELLCRLPCYAAFSSSYGAVDRRRDMLFRHKHHLNEPLCKWLKCEKM